MSQSGSLNNGGGGGGVVNSVQGTSPIQVNGVSGVPQTGNVVVSLLGSFVINTPTVSGIDYKVTGPTSIFTPTSNFTVNSLFLLFDTVVGDMGGLVLNIGTNAATYDNIAANLSPSGSLASGFYSQFILGNTVAIPFVTTGTPIFINITSAETATTCTGRVFLTGSYF